MCKQRQWLPRCFPAKRRCDAKDQSIHLFAMPRAWDPYSPAAAMAAAIEAEEVVEAREL
jgi:hypothetical protein